MKTKLIILISIVVLSVSYGYYYYFIKTLMFSEIVEKSDNPFINLAVNIFDFDTGLTRYDIDQITKKSSYWDKRMREVESIKNPDVRERKKAELLNEMMEDPSMKKVSKLIMNKGMGIGKDLLNMLN